MRLEAFKLWALCLFIALAAAAPTPVGTGVEEKKPGKGQHTPGDHKENHKKGESLCYHAVLLLLTCAGPQCVWGRFWWDEDVCSAWDDHQGTVRKCACS